MNEFYALLIISLNMCLYIKGSFFYIFSLHSPKQNQLWAFSENQDITHSEPKVWSQVDLDANTSSSHLLAMVLWENY